MKKLLSLILALLMVLSCASVIFAEDAVTATAATEANADETASQYYDAVKFLVNYGIMHGKGDTLGVYDNIKRYEMALFIGRIMTGWVEDSAWEDGVENHSEFTDLAGTAAEKFYGAISYVNAKNVINGVGGGKFAPEAGIKYEDALTMAVRALGYTDLAYPWGYIEKAVNLGITDGIEGIAYTETLKREVVAQIIYNAMFAANAEGTTLAKAVFGLDLTYETVVITASDAAQFNAGTEKAAKGYVGYKILNANGTLDEKTYYVTAATFGLEGDHADEAALGTSYRVIFNNGAVKEVEALEMDTVINAGLNSKEGGKYPVQAFMNDYKVSDNGSNAKNFAANGGKIVVYTAAKDSTFSVGELVAVDWNTGDILVKGNDGLYTVAWYYNATLDMYFQHKKQVTANGDIELVGIKYMTVADIVAQYGAAVTTKTYDAANVYASVNGIKTSAYAKLRAFDTDADGAAEYAIYNDYRFGRYDLMDSTVLDAEGVRCFEVQQHYDYKYIGKTYHGQAAPCDKYGDHHTLSLDDWKEFEEEKPKGQYFANHDEVFQAGYEVAVYAGVDSTIDIGGPYAGMILMGDCKEIPHKNARITTFDDAINATAGNLVPVLGEDATFKALGLDKSKYIWTANWEGGVYKQYCGYIGADALWSLEGQGIAKDENGEYVSGTYIIYYINPTTQELDVARTIGAYEEGSDTYFATGVLRAYNMAKKTVTIGDEVFNFAYDELIGTAFNTTNYSKEAGSTNIWPECSAYLNTLFNQFVSYVIVDGKLVWVEASGNEQNDFIIVEGFAGISSDGFIVIDGYRFDGKLDMFRIASYDGWKVGDFFYYADSVKGNAEKAAKLFTEGQFLAIQSYNAVDDAYNVKAIDGIRETEDPSNQDYYTAGKELRFVNFMMNYDFAQIGYYRYYYNVKIRGIPNNCGYDWVANGNGIDSTKGKGSASWDIAGRQNIQPYTKYYEAMSDDQTYILVFAPGQNGGTPVVTYKGKVKDPDWYINGWRLCNGDWNTHIFVGLTDGDVKGFGVGQAQETAFVTFYEQDTLGQFKLPNGKVWYGNNITCGDGEPNLTGYVQIATYNEQVESGKDWYLLGNTEYTITVYDLRNFQVVQVKSDSKDLKPNVVYRVRNGKIVGEPITRKADLYDALATTYGGNTADAVDPTTDNVYYRSGKINTAGKRQGLIKWNEAGDYLFKDLRSEAINLDLSAAYFGHAYAQASKLSDIYLVFWGGHGSSMIAVDEYKAEDGWKLCIAPVAGSDSMNDGEGVACANEMRYNGEVPVYENYNGANSGFNWASINKFLGAPNHDFTMDYITFVNLDLVRKGDNISPRASGRTVLHYLFYGIDD